MVRPLRVGLVCPYSLTIFGGVQMQVLALARELRRRGIEARVLGPCDGPPPDSFVTPLGNSLPTAANGSVAPLAPDPPAVLRTIRAINDEDFDVLHLHEPLAPGPTLTSVVLHRAPTVGTFHAAGASSSYRLLNPLLRRLIRRIDRRIVVSKDALALVDAHFGGEYEVLFNAVEIDVIRSVPPIPTARRTVFFCGRHEERKGLRVLIEAFESLPPDVDLLIASDGPDTAELMRRTAHDPRVHWLGRITDREKFGRLAGSDIFCAPSLGGESFGVVLIEAMAAGTTVVASDLPGYRNVASNDEDALLTEPGSVEKLTAALRTVLDDDALATRLRRTASTRAEQFAMTTLADRYIEIYGQLTSGAPR